MAIGKPYVGRVHPEDGDDWKEIVVSDSRTLVRLAVHYDGERFPRTLLLSRAQALALRDHLWSAADEVETNERYSRTKPASAIPLALCAGCLRAIAASPDTQESA
jgi:hypothetical protein